MKSLDTKSWIESWMPPEAIAGQRHADIYDVLCDISENPNHHLISLDYGKAFDYVNHQIAVSPFSQLGLNPQICQVLMKIWSQQIRYLQLDSVVKSVPVHVSTSLPQGGAFSMVGMMVCLVAPTRHVRMVNPDLVLRTFVDDRTFTGPLTQVLHAKFLWETWSQHLGLQEIHSKTIHYHRTNLGKQQFQNHGILPEQITEKPRILGNEMRSSRQRVNIEKEQKRINEVMQMATRARMLPVGWKRKRVIMSTQALSKAAAGWFFRRPPKDVFGQLDAAVSKGLPEHPSGSPHLQKNFSRAQFGLSL